MKIATRLLLVFAVLVAASMGAVGILLIRESQEAISTSILRDYQEIANQAAGRLESFLDQPLRYLTVTAGTVSMLQADPWKQESVMTKLKIQFPVFSTIVLTDTGGKGLVTTATGTSPADWSGETAFQVAIRGQPFLSPVLFSEAEGPHTNMSVPVLFRGRTIGTLCAKVNMRGLWDLVDSIRIGETGHASVISREAVVVAAPDKRDAIGGTLLEGLAGQTDRPFSQEYVYRNGEKSLRAYAPIANVQWGILVEQPAQEAYAFQRKMRKESFVVIMIGVVLALGVGVVNARSVIRPIRELLDGTFRVAQGDLDHKVTYDGKNEIGQLTDAFNRMTGSLKTAQADLWAEKEFSGHVVEHSPIGILTINAEGYVTTANASMTRLSGHDGDLKGKQISDIPFLKASGLERLLEAGKPEGVLSVKTDGELRTWAVRTSTLDQAGTISTIVLIDDTTERSRAEEALRSSLEEAAHTKRLLLALNQAAQAVHRARSTEDVYEAVGKQVAQAGFRAVVLALTSDGTHLTFSHLGFAPDLLREAERLSGLSAQEYRIPLAPRGRFERVMEKGETIFLGRPRDLLTEALPETVSPLASCLADLLGIERCIVAPLMVGGKTHGLLVVVGAGLTKADIPAIDTFANQAAIAIENAQLLATATEHRRDLQKLSAQLVAAQEAERKRLSRELHDQMGQALTAMKINLEMIEKQLSSQVTSPIMQRLTDTKSLASDTLRQVRELCSDLRPGILDDLGVVPALRLYAKLYAERLNLEVAFDASSFQERLPSELETVLYRVVQEAMTNVARHAQANNVRIHVKRKASTVAVSVEDDGRGFDIQTLEDHRFLGVGVGLLGMRERATSLGGTFSIESRPGKGTKVSVELPVPDSGKEQQEDSGEAQ